MVEVCNGLPSWLRMKEKMGYVLGNLLVKTLLFGGSYMGYCECIGNGGEIIS